MSHVAGNLKRNCNSGVIIHKNCIYNPTYLLQTYINIRFLLNIKRD